MPISLNTFILGGTTDEIFVTVLDDVVLINDFKININALKISSLKEVDVGKDKLKDVDTEEKIRSKLRGEKMIARNLFTDYFKVDQPVDRNVHIPTTGKYSKTLEDKNLFEKLGYYSLQHGFYLLLGHRQGGKTTIAMGLKRWLEDNSSYVVYYLNFNTGITTKKDIYEFWRLYNESKDVVLIMDDVSILNYKSESEKLIIDNFIAMLKELKEQRSVCSIVLNGTENLFTQYVEENKLNVDVDEIVADIYSLTLEHKGLVGICCHYFATNLMVGTNEANLCDWEKHTLIQLPQYIKEQATYKSIIRCLKDLNGNEIEILTEVLYHGTKQATLRGEVHLLLLSDIVDCAAPILRNIMLSRIHRPTIKHSSPIDTTNIDPEWLLARTIENMSIQDISHKYTFNANNQPSEYAFQAEFLGIFKQLISTAYPHLFFLRLESMMKKVNVTSV
ncbi:unnamed protein product [Rhizophagus irregularis]|nr:unnamed protein product [Rhizophagus irregularis]